MCGGWSGTVRESLMSLPTRGLTTLAFLVFSGCVGEGKQGDSHLLSPAEVSARVSELLYRKNLISDPEVNAKMNEFILLVSRDGVSADSVMPEFHGWLAVWTRAHPDRVAAARLQAGPGLGEHRE